MGRSTKSECAQTLSGVKPLSLVIHHNGLNHSFGASLSPHDRYVLQALSLAQAFIADWARLPLKTRHVAATTSQFISCSLLAIFVIFHSIFYFLSRETIAVWIRVGKNSVRVFRRQIRHPVFQA